MTRPEGKVHTLVPTQLTFTSHMLSFYSITTYREHLFCENLFVKTFRVTLTVSNQNDLN